MNAPILVPIPLKMTCDMEQAYILKSDGYIAVADREILDACVVAKKDSLFNLEVTIGKYAHRTPEICIEKNENVEEGYFLTIANEGVTISCVDSRGAFYGLMTLRQLCRQYGNILPFCTIEDEPHFKIRGYMLDVARNKIPTLDTLKQIVDMLSELKYNHLELYFEGAPFKYRNHKVMWEGISVLTGEELVELDKYCVERFIDLVPTQNTFGHMGGWLTDVEGYNDLAECPNGFELEDRTVPWALALCPTEPKTYEFVKDISDDILSYFTSDKYNVCCDEVLELGLGKSKELADEIGKGKLYLNYLLKLHEYCKGKGKTMLFWADMINQYPEYVSELPKDIIALNWGYYNDLPKEESCIEFEKNNVPYCVCPGTAVWNTMVGHTSQMLENVHDTIMKGYRHSAMGMVLTDWGNAGHYQGRGASFPAIAYAAALSWQPVVNEPIHLPQVLDLHLYQDKAEVMGQLSIDIGKYVDLEAKHYEDTAFTYCLLKATLDNTRCVEDIFEKDLDVVEAFLNSFEERIDAANMENKDGQLIKREYHLGIRILKYALYKGRYMIKKRQGKAELDDMGSNICKEAKEILNELSETWLIKNRTAKLQRSLELFLRDIRYFDS